MRGKAKGCVGGSRGEVMTSHFRDMDDERHFELVFEVAEEAYGTGFISILCVALTNVIVRCAGIG